METIPAFDLTRTVAAQPPPNAVAHMDRCGQQIAWIDHHSDTSDYTRGTLIHGAMSTFVRGFPIPMHSALLECYIRAYTLTRRHLRNTSTMHTREDCCAS